MALPGSEERCEFSDSPASLCVCPKHGGPSQRSVPETVSPPPVYDGPRPRAQDILVSKNGVAHRSGCVSSPDYRYLVPPAWGWIDGTRVWGRIGSQPVLATSGNTSIVAVRRCTDCNT